MISIIPFQSWRSGHNKDFHFRVRVFANYYFAKLSFFPLLEEEITTVTRKTQAHLIFHQRSLAMTVFTMKLLISILVFLFAVSSNVLQCNAKMIDAVIIFTEDQGVLLLYRESGGNLSWNPSMMEAFCETSKRCYLTGITSSDYDDGHPHNIEIGYYCEASRSNSNNDPEDPGKLTFDYICGEVGRKMPFTIEMPNEDKGLETAFQKNFRELKSQTKTRKKAEKETEAKKKPHENPPKPSIENKIVPVLTIVFVIFFMILKFWADNRLKSRDESSNSGEYTRSADGTEGAYDPEPLTRFAIFFNRVNNLCSASASIATIFALVAYLVYLLCK